MKTKAADITEEVPHEVLTAARLVYYWMRKNEAVQLNGLKLVAASSWSGEIDPIALRWALERSLCFQSHYAGLLNQYDGGKRMKFETVDAWIERLEWPEHICDLLDKP